MRLFCIRKFLRWRKNKKTELFIYIWKNMFNIYEDPSSMQNQKNCINTWDCKWATSVVSSLVKIRKYPHNRTNQWSLNNRMQHPEAVHENRMIWYIETARNQFIPNANWNEMETILRGWLDEQTIEGTLKGRQMPINHQIYYLRFQWRSDSTTVHTSTF